METVRMCGRLYRPALVLPVLGALACEPPASPQAAQFEQTITRARRTARTDCGADPRVGLGLVAPEVCAGADLFFRETFDGNGRTCATCHPAENNFTIDPAFIAGLPDDDPLFVAEQQPALATLERPALLRDLALVLENVDGFDDLDHRFTMRSTQHTLGLATSVTGAGTGPKERTGWSGDGAPNAGELRDFASGAVTQHLTRSLARIPGVDFRLPTELELDEMVAFQRSIGRTNDIDLAAVRLNDRDAEAGRLLFLGKARCQFCHNDAGANQNGVNRNFFIDIELVRPVLLDELHIPHDGGNGRNPVDVDGDGIPDVFGDGSFNTPPLIEAADTGPFFHTNGSRTVEEAVQFYSTPVFNNSQAGQFLQFRFGAPVALSPGETAQIGRFLRVINAALNYQMALARLEAGLTIAEACGDCGLDVQRGLLSFASREVVDAQRVLGEVWALGPGSQLEGLIARGLLAVAQEVRDPFLRRRALEDARTHLRQADALCGEGMAFTIGQGTLMF